MSAHTAGPWEIKAAEAENTYLRIRGTRLGGRYKVANVLAPVPLGDNPIEAAESHANARLIAAAPDLLEALKAVLYKYAGDGATPDGDMRAFNAARAAIAKAEGT